MKRKFSIFAASFVALTAIVFAIEYNTQVRPTATGYIIGSAADQAIGFWGVTPVVQQTIAALTDSSGGATADGTIGAVTAPTTLTDNGGGTADATVAAMTATTALTVADGAGTNDGTIGAITADASVIAAVQELAAKIATAGTFEAAAKDNFKELTTAQAANRTAIIALTDAVKELATQTNLLRTKLITNGIVAAP